MAKIIRHTESSHWYTPDGKPAHDVEMAKPNAKGETHRPTNLKDARKHGYIPSVTNIIGMLDKPMLTEWKIEQALLASMRLRQKPDESPEEFIRRTHVESLKVTEEAADFGKAMHHVAEEYAFNRDFEPSDPALMRYFLFFKKWFDENVEEVYYVEATVLGDGYAGRMDMKARLKGMGVRTVDFKTREAKLRPIKSDPNRRLMATYDEDILQLAAYKDADDEYCAVYDTPPSEGCTSILIDRKIPSAPYVHHWEEDRTERASGAFHCLVGAWQWLKDYTPPERILAS